MCLLLIDAKEGVTEQDTKVAGEAHEAGKGIIIVVNKWDEIEKDDHTMEIILYKLCTNCFYIGINRTKSE